MRIALATVGTTGDVRPFAVLAHALIGAGHDVTIVTIGPANRCFGRCSIEPWRRESMRRP